MSTHRARSIRESSLRRCVVSKAYEAKLLYHDKSRFPARPEHTDVASSYPCNLANSSARGIRMMNSFIILASCKLTIDKVSVIMLNEHIMLCHLDIVAGNCPKSQSIRTKLSPQAHFLSPYSYLGAVYQESIGVTDRHFVARLLNHGRRTPQTCSTKPDFSG